MEAEEFIKECKKLIKNKYYKKNERNSINIVLCIYDGLSTDYAEFSDCENYWYKCEYFPYTQTIAIQQTERTEWISYNLNK